MRPVPKVKTCHCTELPSFSAMRAPNEEAVRTSPLTLTLLLLETAVRFLVTVVAVAGDETFGDGESVERSIF